VQTHADLLAVRATQLQFRKEYLEEAVHRTRRIRRAAVESRNVNRDLQEALGVGDLVLIWDAVKAVDKSSDRKLDDRWRGPYKVKTAYPSKGYYRLEGLNGVAFPSTTRADRLKKCVELPITLEAEVLKGRLRLYPDTEGLRMVAPQPITELQPPTSVPTNLEHQGQPEAETGKPEGGQPTGWKRWVTTGPYIPNRTSNNAPQRGADKVSKENIIRTTRRDLQLQDSESDLE
jgi:hypothetical protein